MHAHIWKGRIEPLNPPPLVTANELDLLGQVILFFANELDLFIKIKEMVILNNPGTSLCFWCSKCYKSVLIVCQCQISCKAQNEQKGGEDTTKSASLHSFTSFIGPSSQNAEMATTW